MAGNKMRTKRNSDLFAATFMLLAAKMREVDVKTPYASEIKR